MPIGMVKGALSASLLVVKKVIIISIFYDPNSILRFNKLLN